MASITVIDGKRTVVTDEWGEEDFQSVAEDCIERQLTEEELSAVMNLVVESYDANIGINWEVIEIALDTLKIT